MRLAIMLIISTGKFTLLIVWCTIRFGHFICNRIYDFCILRKVICCLFLVWWIGWWKMTNALFVEQNTWKQVTKVSFGSRERRCKYYWSISISTRAWGWLSFKNWTFVNSRRASMQTNTKRGRTRSWMGRDFKVNCKIKLKCVCCLHLDQLLIH